MKPFTLNEVTRATRLWNGPPISSQYLKRRLGFYVHFEALLHEVAHAMARGEETPNKRSPDRTSKFFEKINAMSPSLGLIHEAFALAVESHAIGHLGLTKQIPFLFVCKDTHMNTPDTALTYQEFLRQIDMFIPLPEVKLASIDAAHFMEKLIRGKKKL